MVTSPQSPSQSPSQLTSWNWPILDEEEEAMPEGDRQRTYVSYATQVLRWWYRHRSDVYVSGNLLIRFDPLKPGVAPDTFVVFGVSSEDRDSYTIFEEGGHAPAWVLEVTSESTVKRDNQNKLELYQTLQVQEYFQYDPSGKYLKPLALRGMELVNGEYRPIQPTLQEDGGWSIPSRVLGLELRLLPEGLRFYDPLTGERLLTYDENIQARLQEQQARAQAEQARVQAEQARLREQQARAQAEQARLQEQQAREQAEEKVRLLADRLRQLGIDPDHL